MKIRGLSWVVTHTIPPHPAVSIQSQTRNEKSWRDSCVVRCDDVLLLSLILNHALIKSPSTATNSPSVPSLSTPPPPHTPQPNSIKLRIFLHCTCLWYHRETVRRTSTKCVPQTQPHAALQKLLNQPTPLLQSADGNWINRKKKGWFFRFVDLGFPTQQKSWIQSSKRYELCHKGYACFWRYPLSILKYPLQEHKRVPIWFTHSAQIPKHKKKKKDNFIDG